MSKSLKGAGPPPAELELWSCNPRDIAPWTAQDKARLQECLARVFGWPTGAASAPAPVSETAPLP